ncbi:hypothetical protein, partial [Nannocystis sp.]|uniref:hypothetical protein n=1 Tax=Nannocystis sp. TaxID=1962667 RepID=UPI0025F3B2D8
RSVGFSREGAIPGYFRTADAYIMSRVYTGRGRAHPGRRPKLTRAALPTSGKEPKEKDLRHTSKPPRASATFEVVSDIPRLQ